MISNQRCVIMIALFLPWLLSGQWLESTIYVPDSFCGLSYPSALTCNPTNNKIYVGGEEGDCVIVVDGTTSEKIAKVPVGSSTYPPELCYNPTDNKVYCANNSSNDVTVIDGANNSVITTIPVGDSPWALVYNLAENKVYCANRFGYNVTVIDGATNSVITTIAVGDQPRALVYNPTDNKVYCANNFSNNVTVIDGSSNSVITTIAVGGRPCTFVYNPTNNKVYCANNVGDNVTVIDGASNSVITTITVGDGPWALVYNPTNNKVYCANMWSDDVTVIDGASNDVITTIAVGEFPLALVYNPTNNKVYCTNDDSDNVTVIDGASNSVITTIMVGNGPCALLYNYLNNKVYCVNMDSDNVTVIDGASNSVITTITVGGRPCALVYNPTNNKVYCANNVSDNVTVIDGASNSVITTITVGGRPCALLYNSLNNKVYCANNNSDNVTVIDGATNSVITTVAVGASPQALVYNPTNNKVYCANTRSENVTVIDGATNSVITTIMVGNGPWALVHNSTNNKVYCANAWSNNVTVIDGTTNSVITTVAVGASPQALVYNPTNNKVYCANKYYGNVTVIDGASNSVITTIAVGKFPIALVYNPTDNKVYCANEYDNDVTVIDGATDNVITTIAVGTNPCALLCIPTNNNVYCANYGSNDVTVIDGENNSVIVTIPVGDYPWAFVWNPVQNRTYVANNRSSSISVIRDDLEARKTVFVISTTRLAQFYPDHVNLLKAKLNEICYHPEVQGVILDVDSSQAVLDAFADWETGDSWKRPSKANAVVEAVDNFLESQLATIPSIEYIILVGSDRIIPYFRIPDPANWPDGHESSYEYIWEDSIINASKDSDYVFTDAVYCDLEDRFDWFDFSIPYEYVVSRIIETPSQIVAQIDAFQNGGNTITPSTFFVSGGDYPGWFFFVSDCASEIAAIYQHAYGLNTVDDTLIQTNWLTPEYGSTQFSEHFLNRTHSVRSINNHGSHLSISMPKRGEKIWYYDIINSSAVMDRNVISTLSCHGGLNTVDYYDIGWKDLAEAFASKGVGAYFASTAFSIAAWLYNGYSEKMQIYFSDALCQGKCAGEAAESARNRYWLNPEILTMGSVVKTILSHQLYGLPFYRLETPNITPSFVTVQNGSNYEFQHDSVVVQPDTFRQSFTPDSNAIYFIIPDADIETSADGIPVPKIIIPIDNSSNIVTGLSLIDSSYHQVTPSYPAAVNIIATSDTFSSGIFNLKYWYPESLYNINRLVFGDSLVQCVVVTPVQYNLPTNTWRLYDTLVFEVMLVGAEKENVVDQLHFSFLAEPNPLTQSTLVKYSLPRACDVNIQIYNVLGQRVRLLLNEKKNAGRYTLMWSGNDDHGRNLASGVYFLRFQAGDFVQTKKMIICR